MSKIPILMYHHVAPLPEALRGHRLANLYVSPQAFADQMRWLKRLGFRGMSMSQAIPYLREGARGRIAVITLDDGYVDNLEYALPILQQHGFSATCYAVSAAPGHYNGWDEARTGLREPLMDSARWRQWIDAGMELGAHTRTHPRLTQCDDQALHQEIHVCKAELEDATGTAVTQFCYPYGDYDERVVEVVRAAGYADATTTVRARARPGGDCLQWPRIAVKQHHSLVKFGLRILTGL